MWKFGIVVAILQNLILLQPCYGQRAVTSLGVKTKTHENSDQLTDSKAKGTGIKIFDPMGPYVREVFLR